MSVQDFCRDRSSNLFSQSAWPRNPSAEAAALQAELSRRISGEVRFDNASRAIYATDASNYRQVPIGVVIPKTQQDVIETIAVCRQFSAPLLSRARRHKPRRSVLQRRGRHRLVEISKPHH